MRAVSSNKQAEPRSNSKCRYHSRSAKGGSRKQKPREESPSITQHRIINGNLILVEEDQNGGDPTPLYRTKDPAQLEANDAWVPDDAFKMAH